MRPARILLLVIAIVAGGLAAYFATRGEPPVEQTAVAESETTQVLVAARSVGIGERLTPGHVSWQDWPKNAVRPEYLTQERLPDAPSQVAGAVARFEIFVGEPIRQSKLVRSDQGYLSAVITPGMRAVSVGVSAESGAGGFIVPNDRVDVVLTRREAGVELSETILNNVRVLAIGHRLGELGTSGQAEGDEPQAQTFDRGTIATLELTPVQTETILNSNKMGDLSLVLRSIVDFASEPTGGSGRGSSSVKLIRYGRESSVRAASEEPGDAPEEMADEPAPEPVNFETNTFDSTAPGAVLPGGSGPTVTPPQPAPTPIPTLE